MSSAIACNLGFLPLVFEITGNMHETVLSVIDVAVNKFATENSVVDVSPLLRYWLAVLSFAIHRNVSQGLITRAFAVNSKRFVHDSSSSMRSILDLSVCDVC